MASTGNHSMVSSTDVNGTEVYSSSSGEHVGEIDHLMIDKQSGKVAYAVMGFGGFLGMGEDHHPIPWGALRYDTGRGGFVTDITSDQLQGAPARSEAGYGDRDWEMATYSYYGLTPYWI